MTKRRFLGVTCSSLAIGLFSTEASDVAEAQTGSLLDSKISDLNVGRAVLRPRDIQTTLANLMNGQSETRQGMVVANFRTNGVLTDQGDTIVSVPAKSFVVAKISGSVGSERGQGLTTAFTKLGSRSRSYQVD